MKKTLDVLKARIEARINNKRARHLDALKKEQERPHEVRRDQQEHA